MKKEKAAAKFAKMYANEVSLNHGKSYKDAYSKFYDKYMELVTTEDYAHFDEEYGKNLPLLKIYIAITTYFVSTDFGFSFDESKNIYYGMAKPKWDRFRKLVNFLERLPGGFRRLTRLPDKFNSSYGSSIQYTMKSEKDKCEYIITRCAYIEIFEHYGIRKFCKVMCDGDIGVLGGACKHAKYIRYHDMTEADTCHDVIIRVKK